MIAGPLIGAFVVADMGTTKAFLIDGATFLIAALLTLPIHQRCHPTGDKPSSISSFWNSFFGGFKYFIDNRPILILVITNGLILSSVFLTSSLKIAFADQFISPGGLDASKVLGYINSMNGIGSLIGGVCLPFFVANYLAGKVIVVGMILTSLDLFCFALSNDLSLILPAIFVSGFGFTMANLSSLTLMQANIDNEVRGRALAFYSVILSIIATCSTLAGGWIAGLAGVKFVYLMAGFFCLVTGMFGLILLSINHKDPVFVCHSGAGRNPAIDKAFKI
jgi:predicted MFS family arabinose efflux permease